MYAARVRELAGEGRVALEVYVGHIRGRVEAFDLVERDGLKTLFSFRMFVESRLESFFLPALALNLCR